MTMKFCFLTSLVLFVFCGSAGAQTVYRSRSHTVTVAVSTITLIQVSSGVVNITISGANAVAGQDLMTVTNTATNLLWGINSSLKKVTVSTSLVAPLFTIKLLGVSPTQGTAAPEVTLSTTAKDFLLNVGRSAGNCILRYTAEALASQGTGSDAHTITYTVQTQ